ncbi:GNAT family N-acetyltransferase [Halovulum sp. GXIMD14793]
MTAFILVPKSLTTKFLNNCGCQILYREDKTGMLRRLTARDAATLRTFWAEALRTAPVYFLLTEEELLAIPDSSFASNIDSGYYIGAFDHDERLVGFVVARRGGLERLKHTADIGPIYVHEKSQGRGIGRTLMESVCEQLKVDGLLQSELTVDASNQRAVRLYRSLGFVEFGLRPRSVIVNHSARNDLMMMTTFDGTVLDAPSF